MQAVMAFGRKTFASRAASSPSPMRGKTLGRISRGVSVLGSLSEFAGAFQQASALDQEARDEAMAGRQEFVTATERVNAIDADYNRLVGDQLAAASGVGIDVGSGSVVAAREAAGDDANRERRIIRNTADMNGALRKLRSIRSRDAAKNTRFGATLKFGLDAASAFVPG